MKKEGHSLGAFDIDWLEIEVWLTSLTVPRKQVRKPSHLPIRFWQFWVGLKDEAKIEAATVSHNLGFDKMNRLFGGDWINTQNLDAH